MPGRYPKVTFKEEGMREGMQIEAANVSVDDKIRLLDALGETGIPEIVVGSFVSPRYTPQMARMDELMSKFTPKPGVKYVALALNERGVERAKEYSPPLSMERGSGRPSLSCHMCDIFTRRNTNRSQRQEMERWPQIIAQAQETGVKEAAMGANASMEVPEPDPAANRHPGGPHRHGGGRGRRGGLPLQPGRGHDPGPDDCD